MLLPYKDDDNPNPGNAPVTWALIAANLTIFAFFFFNPDADYERIVWRYGFAPAHFRAVTLLTSLFLHGSWLHLIGNLWFLHVFGPNVERRCGPAKYLLAYLICGVAGSLTQYVFFRHSGLPTIGASGAIAGILGMYLFFFPANRVRIFYFLFILIGTTTIRAIWAIGIWFIFELLAGEAEKARNVQGGVAHLAHDGGFIMGLALAMLFLALKLVRTDRRDLGSHLALLFTGDGAAATNTRNGPVVTGVADAKTITAPEITALLSRGELPAALAAWRTFARTCPQGVLAPPAQLQIALALDRQNEHVWARDAYTRLLAHYSDVQPEAADASLALAGLLLNTQRDTGDPETLTQIRRLLAYAAHTHPAPERRALARRWLEHLG